MNAFSAKQFAQTSLRLFRQEGEFSILVPPEMDLEEMACEYESFGHSVDRDLFRRELNVFCRLEGRQSGSMGLADA